MNDRFLDRTLCRIEQKVALLDRSRPTNTVSELNRLLSAWEQKQPAAPCFEYGVVPDLSGLARILDQIQQTCSQGDAWFSGYASRAAELRQELSMLEVLGTADFARRARRRYRLGLGGRQAGHWAKAWQGYPVVSAATRYRSDDWLCKQSLVSKLRQAIGQHHLPFRVKVRQGMLSAAATGENVIYVCEGLLLTKLEAERIALHEVLGHALPRELARCSEIGLFIIGPGGAQDDEEGRALLLEERAGYLDGERRAGLAHRHQAALAMRAGADFVEVMKLLGDYGVPLRQALQTAFRVFRGGGLGREVVYLPAFARVKRALRRTPQLEEWLSRGRVGLRLARWLNERWGKFDRSMLMAQP